jgi:hypothetical protein
MSNFGTREHNPARADVKSTRTHFEKVSKESIRSEISEASSSNVAVRSIVHVFK